MEEQARQLSAAVAVFRVAGGHLASPARAVIERAQAVAKAVAPKPGSKASPRLAGRVPPRLAAKAKADGDGWAEF
jgi:hypothetical protein